MTSRPAPQHVALCIKLIAAWFVPDVPQSVKNKVLEEKYQTLREKMRYGRPGRAGVGWGQAPGPIPTNAIPASSSSPKSTEV